MRHLSNVLLILCCILAEITAQIPGCDYIDTVDLSNIEPFENGSYQYANVLIPKDNVSNATILRNYTGQVKNVQYYPRGCICHEKVCLHLCCTSSHKFFKNATFSITRRNGKREEVNVLEKLTVVTDFEQSCDTFPVNKNEEPHWTLFEIGLLFDHKRNIQKRDYCLVPIKVNDDNYKFVPHFIETTSVLKSEISLLDALRVVSVLCMILTIATYLYLSKFREVYDKCCLCYFACLTVSFALLWTDTLIYEHSPSKWMCFALGYSIYYAVMAMFLWLLMINLTLWKTFEKVRRKPRLSFKKCNLFAWGVAAALLAATGLSEYFLQPEKWLPGVDIDVRWIKRKDWSAMIYFYGHIILAILINIRISIKTGRSIYKQGEENCGLSDSGTKQNVTNAENFFIFLRLFAIIGLLWLPEIIGYVAGITDTWIVDTLFATQGMFLFFVAVLNKNVLKSLYEVSEKNERK